jgi:hypothetical protein
MVTIRELIKQKLYNKIADYLSVARGYFIASLYGPSWARKLARAEEDLRERMKDSAARLREAFAYADRFLKKFRENREEGWTYSAQEKPAHNPYCKHLKGGRLRSITRDYNVAAHTFADGRTKIWCLNGCGFEAYPKDVNWAKAIEMAEQSSNRASTTERIFSGKPEVVTRVVYQDKI